MKPKLRDYQVAAVDHAMAAVQGQRGPLVMVAPTGAGKSLIAAEIMMQCWEMGVRPLFVAHRRELIHQTVSKLLDSGLEPEDVGVWLGAESRNTEAPVLVASIQTLSRRSKPSAGLLIVDECHHLVSDSYTKLSLHYQATGAAVVGFTATPYRANGDGLGTVAKELYVVAYPSQLIDAGYIMRPRLFVAPETLDLSHVRTVAGDYHEGQLADIVDKPMVTDGIIRNWQLHSGSARTLVFAVNVAHSIHIVDAFRTAGVSAEHVDGDMAKSERDGIFERLRSGVTRVVCNVGVATEGFDIPAVKAAVLARPTKSLGLYIQMCGRALRPYGSDAPVVLDHGGCVHRHGPPTLDREERMSLSFKSHEKGEAPLRTCRMCQHMQFTGLRKCEACGFEFPRPKPPDTEGDATLVELTYEQRKAARQAGPCSSAQAATLRRYRLRDDISFAQAQSAIGQIASAGWAISPALAGRLAHLRKE